MIFLEYASPTPGRAFNWSSVAVFISSSSVLIAGADFPIVGGVPCVGGSAAKVRLLDRITAKVTATIQEISFFMVCPPIVMEYSH